MRRVSVFLITLALIAGMVGCVADPVHDPDPEPDPDPDIRHELSISATIGGSVTSPGEGTFEYDARTVVFLYAVPDECYRFVNWTGDTVANPTFAVTTVTMDADKSITANFALARYTLRVYSRVGGVVISPSEEESEYDCGTVINLVAEPEEGYQFTYWTGSVGAVYDVNATSTTVTMMGDYTITANFAKEVRNWHDLHAIRDNLSGHYVLMNDLDSNTSGYAELASPAANGGKGWEPIGSLVADPLLIDVVDPMNPFSGILDGQSYEITGLFVGRSDEDGVGLFGSIDRWSIVQNLGLVNAEVIGLSQVGGLAGINYGGAVSKCYYTGAVTGHTNVGGLVGANWGNLSNCRLTGSVAGHMAVGGLTGYHGGVLDNSHVAGSITGWSNVAGLVGHSNGAVDNSYSSASVTGEGAIGGLVGLNNWGTVNNSHYNYDEVLINGQRMIAIGALFGDDFEQWLSNDKSLDVNERLSRVDGYYVIKGLSDFKQLLAFGQDGSLTFRLEGDLDLRHEPNFYVPYLAGVFDGNGHKITNLSLQYSSLWQVGLFGFLASPGIVTRLHVENARVTGHRAGGLVGGSFGTLSDSYCSGSIAGDREAGGLVGALYRGTLRNSHFTGSVTGPSVGGLLGWQYGGAVSNAHYSCDEVLINGRNLITTGALSSEDFEQWLANGKRLDVNERLSQEHGYYLIDTVGDLKQLLAFGQDDSLKFKLRTDLDLRHEPNFYVPYLAGEFDGNGNRIHNLSFGFDFVSQVGLFGYVASSGRVTQTSIQNANISGSVSVANLVGWNAGTISKSSAVGSVTGSWRVGGLVGGNNGAVSNSFSSGSVLGDWQVGGLVGENWGRVANSYSTGSVRGDGFVGGLLGWNKHGSVSACYSSGRVIGDFYVGGLVGRHTGGTVHNSFWDVETSGTEVSEVGTGKTTAEMRDLTTFTRWDIGAVASGETNSAYIWNIVDGQTYPFLSWQSWS